MEMTASGRVELIAGLLQKCYVLLKDYLKGNILFEKLIMLEKITFTDIDNDKKIISLISEKNAEIEEKSIYLNLTNSKDSSIFFAYSNVEDKHYMEFLDFFGYHKINISEEELGSDYITLREALENSIYLGYKEYIVALGRNSFVLYKIQSNNRTRYLILNDKGYQLTDAPVGYTIEGAVPELYQDKEYVQNEIKKQVLNNINNKPRERKR